MKTLLKCAIGSLLVMIVFFIAIPQRNLIHSLTISILIFEWFFSILLLGVPSWRDSARKFITIFKPVYIPFIFVIVPYFLILISGGTTLASVLDFILWYLLPTIIFLLPEFLEAKTQQKVQKNKDCFEYNRCYNIMDRI